MVTSVMEAISRDGFYLERVISTRPDLNLTGRSAAVTLCLAGGRRVDQGRHATLPRILIFS
jgi:hypothetical protein